MGVAESPAKFKPKLPGGGGGGGPVGYVCGAPLPRCREPYLYPFKLPLVAVTLTAVALVLLSPWPRYQAGLWAFVFFSSCSLVSVACQAVRMATLLRTYRRLYLAAPPPAPEAPGAPGCGAGLKEATMPGAKVMLVDAPSRPGHKKALRKGHRSTLSLDAVDCCDQAAESVALVIDCEDWSESASGSGSDWAAGPPRWNHVFVIPNYKEDMATLTATLEQLAGHAWASSYTILLAMESKEVGAAHKAGQLQEQFGCSFASIVFTLHVLDPAEMPGKASNVNSAVRQFYHMAPGDRAAYMLTIIDADALVPFEYVQQLESASAAQPNPGGNVYAAPVLFEQDNSGVPGIVRATDYMWSALAAQNLSSWFEVGFPISNYSLSLKLVHDIGYWDTFADAIGEDMHMYIKAFLATHGAARLLPLHAPINMAHIQGPNYLRSLWARFLQAERHMRGVADTAYVMYGWPSAAFSWRKVVLLVACLEAHMIPVVTLSALVLLPVYYNLVMAATTGALPRPGALPAPMRVLSVLGQANLVCVVFILACYEHLRGIVRRHVYRLMDGDKHERCWWNCPRYVLHVANYLTLFVSVGDGGSGGGDGSGSDDGGEAARRARAGSAGAGAEACEPRSPRLSAAAGDAGSEGSDAGSRRGGAASAAPASPPDAPRGGGDTARGGAAAAKGAAAAGAAAPRRADGGGRRRRRVRGGGAAPRADA
ncbi:hypothetical protein HT031_005809 [Scenedesmus sp. PABB004]|nr:hypothetical protein HT031_005809 [Scenedesmus sp. PABB004]